MMICSVIITPQAVLTVFAVVGLAVWIYTVHKYVHGLIAKTNELHTVSQALDRVIFALAQVVPEDDMRIVQGILDNLNKGSDLQMKFNIGKRAR